MGPILLVVRPSHLLLPHNLHAHTLMYTQNLSTEITTKMTQKKKHFNQVPDIGFKNKFCNTWSQLDMTLWMMVSVSNQWGSPAHPQDPTQGSLGCPPAAAAAASTILTPASEYIHLCTVLYVHMSPCSDMSDHRNIDMEARRTTYNEFCTPSPRP